MSWPCDEHIHSENPNLKKSRLSITFFQLPNCVYILQRAGQWYCHLRFFYQNVFKDIIPLKSVAKTCLIHNNDKTSPQQSCLYNGEIPTSSLYETVVRFCHFYFGNSYADMAASLYIPGIISHTSITMLFIFWYKYIYIYIYQACTFAGVLISVIRDICYLSLLGQVCQPCCLSSYHYIPNIARRHFINHPLPKFTLSVETLATKYSYGKAIVLVTKFLSIVWFGLWERGQDDRCSWWAI